MEDQKRPRHITGTPQTEEFAADNSAAAQTPRLTSRRPQTVKGPKQASDEAGLSWQGWTVLVVLLLGVVVILRMILWPRPVGVVERGVCGIFLAAFVTTIVSLAISTQPTSAVATGELNLGLFRMKYRILGPGATLPIVFFAFMFFTAGAYQTIDVRLYDPSGTPLERDFKVSWHHPDTGPHSKDGQKGNADLRGLPVGLAEIDLAITCPGYKVKDKGPYPIKDRTVRVIIVPDISPPLTLENFPYIAGEMMPDQKTVDQAPKVDPKLVTFHYQNLTGEDLTLLAWDSYKHYHPSGDLKGRSKWIAFPFKAGPTQIYEAFEKGSGWFIFYVQDRVGKNHFLAKRSIFESRNPWLVVTKDRDHYVAKFRFDD